MRTTIILLVIVLLAGGVAVSAPALTAAQPPLAPAAVPAAAVELVADGFVHPMTLREPPDGSGRLFVVEQTGKIWILNADGERLAEPFLDLSDRLVDLNLNYDERGLLGLAFHPAYADNGRFFVYYSAPLPESGPGGWDHTNVLSEFRVSASDPNMADPSSEAILLQEPWPYFQHNGGTLAFGPADGMLYLSWGDGGNANDTDQGSTLNGHVEDWYPENRGGNGQDISQNPMGSLLRLDVSTPMTYTVPGDNPFVGQLGSDLLELQWAYGFRNPYRFSFDMGPGHRLFAGDVGQQQWEEINVVVKGGNYGWNVKEGSRCLLLGGQAPGSCPDAIPLGVAHPDAGAPLIDPLIELPNSANAEAHDEALDGLAIVGGYVHRNPDLPDLYGHYLFGVWSGGHAHDHESGEHAPGQVFVARPAAEGLWGYEPLPIRNLAGGTLRGFLLSFAQDSNGDVYLLTSDTAGPTGDSGRIWKLVQPAEVLLPLVVR